ncbi:MAG: hypothetical protein ACOYYF_14945, partial [Chloroflexota bacterium]
PDINGRRLPGRGDIIRVRWQEVSATQLRVRVDYYDASAAAWYLDVIDDTRVLTNVNGVNFLADTHRAATVTIDSNDYTIKSQTVGTLATFGNVSSTTYTISGNTGIGGVTLSYVDGTAKTVTSAADGSYSINVPSGWSGTVTPSLAGVTFTPTSRSYTNVTSNFTAQDYTPSSFIISGNAGASGVTLSYTDGTPKTATSAADGSYSLTVSYNWSGTVTPSHPCYTFTPASRTYTNVTANQTAQNYTAAFNSASGCANVNLFIGPDLKGIFGIPPLDLASSSYPSTLAGPVKVISANGEPIFTTQVVTSGGSYNELAGFPVNQFTTEYWFPYYDHGYPNVTGSKMRTWILVGNPSTTQTAEVEIYIGGVLKGSYSIAPGANVTPRWIGVVGGPVRVVSTNGVNIFASERVFTVPYNSFNEVMGYPANQFTTEYWFPWYDTVYMDTYVLVGNTSSSQSASVDIYIGATKMGSYTIAPNATLKQRYAAKVGGPLRVVSTNGVNIVASEYTLSGTQNSFNEVMGYPFNQFTTEYWFPYYD